MLGSPSLSYFLPTHILFKGDNVFLLLQIASQIQKKDTNCLLQLSRSTIVKSFLLCDSCLSLPFYTHQILLFFANPSVKRMFHTNPVVCAVSVTLIMYLLAPWKRRHIRFISAGLTNSWLLASLVRKTLWGSSRHPYLLIFEAVIDSTYFVVKSRPSEMLQWLLLTLCW